MQEAVGPGPESPVGPVTTRELLASVARQGFDTQFVPSEGAALRCTRCGTTSGAGRFLVEDQRRFEGASDPDDMTMVVVLRCPSCQAGGAVVLGYGPAGSAEDADLLSALPPLPTHGLGGPVHQDEDVEDRTRQERAAR